MVSLSIAQRKKGEDLIKVEFLSIPITVNIAMDNNLTVTTVKGSAVQLDYRNLQPVVLDTQITVHRIDTPPKALVTIRFLYPPTNESLRVLVMEDFRPDYDLMTHSRDTVVINSSNPVYPLNHRPVDIAMFLYMAVLPEKNVAINKTVDYEFEVSQNQCRMWVEGQWTSIGCTVIEATTTNETVCSCNHLSIFAAAFPIPPQEIDPFEDAKLFLTVLENPLVVCFVIILFVIFLLLVLWGRHKDGTDATRGKVIILEDNFPEDNHPYLLAVHTSARFNAGTTAHVGIQVTGTFGQSRTHILSCPRRHVLTRHSDDWFMIYTPKPLGDIYALHVWHDNYGSRPEWNCSKIVVYDLEQHTESLFIVEQWLALREGAFPEANLVIATDTDMLNVKRVFLANSVLGLRDSHSYLSVFVRHPRSEVSRVQRISILMCSVMVAMLCSIMFYVPEDEDSPTDDFQYTVGTRELLVSVESLVMTAALSVLVLMSFRKSYKVLEQTRYHSTIRFRRDEIAEASARQSLFLDPDKRRSDPKFYKSYVRFVAKAFKEPPLVPVYMGDDAHVQRRKVWYIIAWTSCIIIIGLSAYFVMLYGLKLGFIQSQLWMTSLVMSMGEDIFVMGPGRIIIVAILLSMAFQVSTKVGLHVITLKEAMNARPNNDLKHLNILLSQRTHPMYTPLSSSARFVMLRKQEVRRKWWDLIDFMNALCFMIVVSSVIYQLWTSSYHEVEHLTTVFSKSHMKRFGIDITNIKNISMVDNYLRITLIEMIFNLWWYNQDLLNVDIPAEGIQKYWLQDFVNKPISNALLRQVRVVPDECRIVYFDNFTGCLLPWSLLNKDDNAYGEKWFPATYQDVIRENSPWVYEDRYTPLWWLNQRFYGIYGTLYDVSGYQTSVGPSLFDAQKILTELSENFWQDWYTRGCFVTVTVYNVNVQTFSQITVLFEYFVEGSVFAGVSVMSVSRMVLVGVWEYLFFFFAVYYTFRAGFLINRSGLIDYLKSFSNVTRIIIVLLSYLAIIVWCVHHRTSIKYAEKYMKTMQTDYFDFDGFTRMFEFLQFVLSLLLCFAIVRAVMLLRGGRKILNAYYTLIISLYLVCWLTLGFLVVLVFIARVQYLFNCEEYFTIKELVLPQKMSSHIQTSVLDDTYMRVFLLLRAFLMYTLHLLFVIVFLYYTRIAKAYRHKSSDSFNFITFLLERITHYFSDRKRLMKRIDL